jgi:hypothetical protein
MMPRPMWPTKAFNDSYFKVNTVKNNAKNLMVAEE